MNEGCDLELVELVKSLNGNEYASILKSEITDNISRWAGYVMRDKPFNLHLKRCVSRLWRHKCSLEIFSCENGFFFFKFSNAEECERVLHGVSWLFDGQLIILKKWTEKIKLERDLMSTMPVWIRFLSLHLKF